MAKIKKVTVNYPEDINEYHALAAKSIVRILCSDLPPEKIRELRLRLEVDFEKESEK